MRYRLLEGFLGRPLSTTEINNGIPENSGVIPPVPTSWSRYYLIVTSPTVGHNKRLYVFRMSNFIHTDSGSYSYLTTIRERSRSSIYRSSQN